MNVDDTQRNQIDDGLRNDLAIADHHHGLGGEPPQSLDGFRPPHTLRLENRQAQAECGLLHGRWSGRLAAAARPVGLRHHRQNFVAGFHHALERRDRKSRRSQKDQPHPPHSHSPARCFFLIFRLMRSRLSALMWVM